MVDRWDGKGSDIIDCALKAFLQAGIPIELVRRQSKTLSVAINTHGGCGHKGPYIRIEKR